MVEWIDERKEAREPARWPFGSQIQTIKSGLNNNKSVSLHYRRGERLTHL